MNEFIAGDCFIVRGELVFSGYSPIRCHNRDNALNDFRALEPWTINGKLYRIIGVESFALPSIFLGAPIGLMVKEWWPICEMCLLPHENAIEELKSGKL